MLMGLLVNLFVTIAVIQRIDILNSAVLMMSFEGARYIKSYLTKKKAKCFFNFIFLYFLIYCFPFNIILSVFSRHKT